MPTMRDVMYERPPAFKRFSCDQNSVLRMISAWAAKCHTSGCCKTLERNSDAMSLLWLIATSRLQFERSSMTLPKHLGLRLPATQQPSTDRHATVGKRIAWRERSYRHATPPYPQMGFAQTCELCICDFFLLQRVVPFCNHELGSHLLQGGS